MIPGITGSLLSADALERVLPDALSGELDDAGGESVRRRVRAWHLPLRSDLGPATGSRTLFDRLAVPLLSQLGYRVMPDGASRASFRGRLEAHGRLAATLLVTDWGQDPSAAWRDAVHQGIGHGVRWCFCVNGPVLRAVDSLRTYSRQFVEFDLETSIDNERTFGVFWGLLRGAAMARTPPDARPLLERAIELSDQHRAAVRTSLQQGVNEALAHLIRAFEATTAGRGRTAHIAPSGKRQTPCDGTFDEALVVIYRVLFLLFAEARGLVPRWHPVYRNGYTIEALREPVEMQPRPRGLWETLQAIARLAHRGCRIGALRVPPFNGPLFSPADAPLADSRALDDADVREALLSLTTRRARTGRERIAYGDLGVEQLGGVYERLLDFEPSASSPVGAASPEGPFVRTERRRMTGSFYTPRPLTEYLVRRTLAPLVQDASPDAILGLRVLDPAMGSGAFLVAACRFLATAYEQALVRTAGVTRGDITPRERADFRRAIAQRSLFGVDINSMAVQLGRLSLWLATLAADRPLTFLDHRLRTGNSLVGASPTDLMRQPPGARSRRRPSALPLFDDDARDEAVRQAVGIRSAIAVEPGDTIEQVRAKERALADLNRQGSSLNGWKDVCALWCAEWFAERDGRRGRTIPFGALADARFGRGSLPDHIARPLLEGAARAAAETRFFHWTLEFPEVFHDVDGAPLERGGFDAVIGNPPWEMLRGDRGDAATRDAARREAVRLTEFARSAGIYTLQGDGHANLYQLFLERALSLVRPGGRVGMVVPAGLATDTGAARLRQVFLERTAIDCLVSIENRSGVFPIHRGLKFLLLTTTTDAATATLPCHFGVRRLESLDRLPDVGSDPFAVMLPRSLLERLSGELAIPDVRSQEDVDLVTRIAFAVPALGDSDGWGVRFGRELNATEDRHHFVESVAGLPVIEGKQVTPFCVDVTGSGLRIPTDAAAGLVDPARFARARLAFRDVASATNRLTLIAAIVPAGTITTHTLFCQKDGLDEDGQQFLCGMFNSFVANYLVRARVGTHVTTAIIDRLRVPKPERESSAFREIAGLAARLAVTPLDAAAGARLQALAATLYGLNRSDFSRVLETFPLVARADRAAALSAFCDIVS
jgi:hypothetical protein